MVWLGSLTTVGSACHILSHLWGWTILASLIYWLRHISKIEVVTIVRLTGLTIIVINTCICVLSILETIGVVPATLTSSVTMLWWRSLRLLAICTLILKYSVDPLNKIGSFRYRWPSTWLRSLLLRRISMWNCLKLLPCLLRTVHTIDISLVVVLVLTI